MASEKLLGLGVLCLFFTVLHWRGAGPSTAPLPDPCAAQASDWLANSSQVHCSCIFPPDKAGRPLFVPLDDSWISQSLQLLSCVSKQTGQGKSTWR